MPIISIIIPVYNSEKYLSKCIDSVLAQTFTDYELILVDDGSTDRSAVICDDYAIKDARIKVIHKENGGVSTARNIGLINASGDYIGFIDSDDYVEPNMYTVLFELIQKHECDISICGFKVIDEDKYKIERIQNSGQIEFLDREGLVSKETDMPWTIRLDTINKLFKKSIIDGLMFDEKLKCAEDTLFLHQALMRMKKGVFIDLPLYVNVRHSGSAMRGRLHPKNYYQSYHVDFAIHMDIKKEYPQLAERSYLVLLNNCIWKLEDVCKNLKGRATQEDKHYIRLMRRFMLKVGLKVFQCKTLKFKQKVGLFMIVISLKDRDLHYV